MFGYLEPTPVYNNKLNIDGHIYDITFAITTPTASKPTLPQKLNGDKHNMAQMTTVTVGATTLS